VSSNRNLSRRYSLVTMQSKDLQTQDGTRVEVVGVVENGRYQVLTESQQPRCFLRRMAPISSGYFVIRQSASPQELGGRHQNVRYASSDAGLPAAAYRPGLALLQTVLLPSSLRPMALRSYGLWAQLYLTDFLEMGVDSVSNGCVSYGIRMALGAKRKEVLQAALERPLKLLVFGSAAGLCLGLLGQGAGLIVYQSDAQGSLVMAGVVSPCYCSACWLRDSAQRALAVIHCACFAKSAIGIVERVSSFSHSQGGIMKLRFASFPHRRSFQRSQMTAKWTRKSVRTSTSRRRS